MHAPKSGGLLTTDSGKCLVATRQSAAFFLFLGELAPTNCHALPRCAKAIMLSHVREITVAIEMVCLEDELLGHARSHA